MGIIPEKSNHIQPATLINAIGITGGARRGKTAKAATMTVTALKNTTGIRLLL